MRIFTTILLLLMFTDAVRNIVRSEKLEQLYNVMQSGEKGMIRLEQRLAQLIKEEKIDEEVALAYSIKPDLISLFLNKTKK